MNGIRASKYIVIGRYDCERNSWIPGGDIRHVCSGHNTEPAAWHAAEKHHTALGGCDGSDSLTDVMVRGPRMNTRKARQILEDARWDSQVDWYKHAGYLYLGCDYWAAHKIVPAYGGLAAVVKE